MKKDGCFCELLESRVGEKLVKMLLVYFVSFVLILRLCMMVGIWGIGLYDYVWFLGIFFIKDW